MWLINVQHPVQILHSVRYILYRPVKPAIILCLLRSPGRILCFHAARDVDNISQWQAPLAQKTASIFVPTHSPSGDSITFAASAVKRRSPRQRAAPLMSLIPTLSERRRRKITDVGSLPRLLRGASPTVTSYVPTFVKTITQGRNCIELCPLETRYWRPQLLLRLPSIGSMLLGAPRCSPATNYALFFARKTPHCSHGPPSTIKA
jgi:hypothetical protein